ncbi:MarP family serine protease [Microbacterium sp. Root180]|uniref:MarP family serine protease n=1 Tax=Microbacterium sp. Root180 TaxID=1736483 RepID=UPI0006F5C139|nr:MarP family serine protease [Microbacterium sp. Root180]KRB39113.1 colicin V production protein [Microbacterium sp. Root180]
MIVVDVLLLVLLALGLAAGIVRGLSGSIGLFAGLVLGAAAAFWLVPIVNDALPSQQWRPAILLATAAALVIGGAALGSAAGSALRRGVDKVRPLRAVDRVLGGVAGVVVAALTLSLAASSLAATGMPVVSTALSSSSVLRTIDRLTPPPVATALAELRGFVFDEGLPALGDLLDSPPVDIPPVDLADPELATAAASVARVSGTAFSCGRSSTGSGFVVAPDRIVTNAHVVAGVERPLVELPGVAAREGRIVYFDPVDDLAVIAVDGLGVAPLPFATTLPAGSPAVVQGYPLGGPFTMVGAGVLSAGTVPIPDIYDESAAPREIYDLRAAVRPGNSGGPLLTEDGAVAGVVFARAENDAERGYAMTMAELTPVAAQAPSLTDQVPSGRCIG